MTPLQAAERQVYRERRMTFRRKQPTAHRLDPQGATGLVAGAWLRRLKTLRLTTYLQRAVALAIDHTVSP